MADVNSWSYTRVPKMLLFSRKSTNASTVPLAVSKLDAKIKIVGTKILGSPQGVPPFYRIVEVHFSVHASSRSVRRF